MSELTPERIRGAADILEACADGASYMAVAASALRDRADRMEREQAAEAKREKRVQELGYELMQIDSPGRQHPCVPACHLRTARELITRYPALLEGAES